MDAFSQLRKQGREKRDEAVRLARDKYAATLKRIGCKRTPRKPIAACVNSVLLMDRLFTSTDVMVALKASDPQRNWRKQLVVNHICKLGRHGILRRRLRGVIQQSMSLWALNTSPCRLRA